MPTVTAADILKLNAAANTLPGPTFDDIVAKWQHGYKRQRDDWKARYHPRMEVMRWHR